MNKYLLLVMVFLRLRQWFSSELSWNMRLFGFFIQLQWHKINFLSIYQKWKVWREGIYFKLFVYLINVILKFISLLVCSKVLSVEIFKIFYILKQTFNKLNILFLEFAVKCLKQDKTLSWKDSLTMNNIFVSHRPSYFQYRVRNVY